MKLRWFAVLALFVVLAPVAAQANEGTQDVLVLAGSDATAIASQIEALGGRVAIRYRNVPALAARIPAHQVGAVRALAGVVAVEKDVTMYTNLDVTRGKDRLQSVRKIDLAASGVKVKALNVRAGGIHSNSYVNYLLSGAADVWPETGFGDGSIVAVVDTGTNPTTCLTGAVIGAPGFPHGFDAFGDNDADAPDNNPHGTWVGNTIAAACSLALDKTGLLYNAIAPHAPELLYDFGVPGLAGLDLLGIAPLAQIYPVKVFSKAGGGTETSVILAGLDHVLDLKKGGVLDIDVVNMSLGGSTVFDGRDTFDRFVDEVRKAGIVVVSAAGNAGPVPNTVGSPGTSLSSITAGATDESVSSRIFYEYVGLVTGMGPGQGLVMRPTTETRIVNFSSRGPTSDGRGKPEISALGTWNFLEDPQGFSWVTGTSFSSPTVAGAAALLNAYWEGTLHKSTDPGKIRNALLLGADDKRVGKAWRGSRDQGEGVLDVKAALDRLKSHKKLSSDFTPLPGEKLESNVLDASCRDHSRNSRATKVSLKPAEVEPFVFEINPSTSKVTIEISDLAIPDNSAVAFFPNALQVDVQSAKRTDAARPIDTFLLDSFFADDVGGSFTIEIEDGPWTFAGIPVADQPMEPGLMKLTLAGDFVNQKSVGAKVKITREEKRNELRRPKVKSLIEDGDVFLVPITIPAGVSRATFDLQWIRDWTRFPTSDLDLILLDSDFNEISFDGATLNAPERAVLNAPVAGDYLAVVQGFEVDKPDFFKLFLSLD